MSLFKKNNSPLNQEDLSFVIKKIYSQSMVIVANSKGKIIHVNDFFIDHTGYQLREILGWDFLFLARNLPQQDRLDIDEKVNTENIWRGEMEKFSKNGVGFFAESFIFLIPGYTADENKYVVFDFLITDEAHALLTTTVANEELENMRGALLNVMEDIEDEKEKLKKLNERFELATNAAKIGVWEWRVQEDVLKADDIALEVFDLKPEDVEKSFYNKILDKIDPKHRKDTMKLFQESLEKGNIFEEKIPIVTSGGFNKIIKISANIKRGTSSKPMSLIGVCWDITEEEEVNKIKTEFVSLASHQLRTPLSASNWYTEMLLAGDVGEFTGEQKNYLQKIYDSNQRMNELVNALLNVSRLEMGSFLVEPEKSNPEEIIKNLVSEMALMAQNRKVNMKVDSSGDIPEMYVDRSLFKVIFQNLLSNAIKYTSPGGEVRINIKKPTEKGGEVLFEVEDNGWGIPEDQRDKIFGKFFRADNVKEQNTDGTGLGLYITRMILGYIGGEIAYTSKLGEGTTFYVKIPITWSRREGVKKIKASG